MSWLARSIANSLLIDEDDRPNASTSNHNNTNHLQSVKQQEGSDSQALAGGVKGDLSEFTESLARQLWGVASFLSPPPPPPPPPLSYRFSDTTQLDPSVSVPNRGGSSVSGDEGVSVSICEDSRLGDGDGNGALHSLNDGQEKKDRAFVGVTEEVLAFAMNIAHHPETWLDFPLSEEEDSDDFEMSDTQWNHVTLVEHLVPRLAALRIELCPIHMSESYFWKVYFVLLHPRLNKHDAVLLSTPQIVAARSMWMKELQMQMKQRPDLERLDDDEEFKMSSSNSHPTTQPEPTTYNKVEEKEAIEDIDEDGWIHENLELDGYDGPDVPDEDISFSDLEDDDELAIPTKSQVI